MSYTIRFPGLGTESFVSVVFKDRKVQVSIFNQPEYKERKVQVSIFNQPEYLFYIQDKSWSHQDHLSF